MNKILQLFDPQYVADLFNKKVLPLYPDFEKINVSKITPIKKNVWTTTYHVVIEFLTTFSSPDGSQLELPIMVRPIPTSPEKIPLRRCLFSGDEVSARAI